MRLFAIGILAALWSTAAATTFAGCYPGRCVNYGGPCYACGGPANGWGYQPGYQGNGSWGYYPTSLRNGLGYLGRYPCGFGPEYGRGYFYRPSWGKAPMSVGFGGYSSDGGYGY